MRCGHRGDGAAEVTIWFFMVVPLNYAMQFAIEGVAIDAQVWAGGACVMVAILTSRVGPKLLARAGAPAPGEATPLTPAADQRV